MAGITGNVEKSRQQRSRHFAVLTYYEYAPRVKNGCGLAGRTFLNIPYHWTLGGSSEAFIGYWGEYYNRP